MPLSDCESGKNKFRPRWNALEGAAAPGRGVGFCRGENSWVGGGAASSFLRTGRREGTSPVLPVAPVVAPAIVPPPPATKLLTTFSSGMFTVYPSGSPPKNERFCAIFKVFRAETSQ